MGLCKKLLMLAWVVLFSVSIFASEQGDVVFFLFHGEQPAAKVKVVIPDFGDYRSDSSGVLELKMPEATYQAHIYNSEDEYQTITFSVPPGEETYINVTLVDDKLVKTDIRVTQPAVINASHSTTGPADHWLAGKVIVHKKKTPLAGAKVIVHGTQLEVTTDNEGRYSAKVPAGNYSLTFIHQKYSSERLEKAVAQPSQRDQAVVSMKPSGLELEEFVVLSPNLKSSVSALLEIRRSHFTVADLIGSEQISKSGDSDAGASLRRVTGLSLVDGKYVYVRGLGERYSSTLLNSAMVPSPDPSRRVVPLDLFPASVIENMVVQKGYSPEMPGEFGGGVIQIKTKSLPAKKYIKISLSAQLEDVGPTQSYEGSDKDWSGYDSGLRSMPKEIQNYVNQGKDLTSLSPQERKALAKVINKNYNVRPTTGADYSSVPNMTFSMGDRFRKRKFRFGYNLSALYSNKWDFETMEKASYNLAGGGSGLVEDGSSTVAKSKNKIKFGSLLGLGLQYRKHKLAYNGSLLRNSEKYIHVDTGIDSERENFDKKELGWRERSVLSHQLSGESLFRTLNEGKLEWHLSQSEATLSEPDNKMYTYKSLDGVYQLETENASSSNTVMWNYMPDKMINYGFSYTQPFDIGPVKEAKFVTGYNEMTRDRTYESRTFYYSFDENQPVSGKGDPDDVFSQDSAELYQQASNTDNYSASQKIQAYFGNLILPISKLTLTGGARFENSVQEVQSFKLFNAGQTISRLETVDTLPALSATYKVTEKMQLRANYSETVSRPDLREISKTVWQDLDLGVKFGGNPNLSAAQIQNYGIRWEWFPNRGEVLSFGYFRKNFRNPIEAVFGSLSPDGRVVNTAETRYTFLNMDEAISQGLEFEFRKKMRFFTFGGNYTFIQSDVVIPPDRAGQLTSKERPLQGQSPYLLNLQLDIEPSEKWGSTFTFLYNTIGRRITGVGVDDKPDEFQEEISSLDFVASQKMAKNWKVKLKAKNLLNPEVTRTQGDKVTRQFTKGREYSIGLSATF